MATLYDGVPVFAPVAGATALAANQVALQAKLILGLEERAQGISLAGGVLGDAGGWTIAWTIGGAPDLTWVSGGGAGQEILFPVNFRAAERITECHVTLAGAVGNPTGGSIVLYKMPLDGAGVAAAMSTFGCAGDFWDTDGVITAFSATGLTLDSSSTDSYFIGVQSPTGAAVVCTLYGIKLVTQFHKGT